MLYVWAETAASGAEGSIRVKLDGESVVSDLAVEGAKLFGFGRNGEKELKAWQIAVWYEGEALRNSMKIVEVLKDGDTVTLKERKREVSTKPVSNNAGGAWSSAAQFAPPREQSATPARSASPIKPVVPVKDIPSNSVILKKTQVAMKREEHGKFARSKAAKKLEGDSSAKPRWASTTHPAPVPTVVSLAASPNPPATPERRPLTAPGTGGAAVGVKADPIVVSKKKIKESTEGGVGGKQFERATTAPLSARGAKSEGSGAQKKPAVPKQQPVGKKVVGKAEKPPVKTEKIEEPVPPPPPPAPPVEEPKEATPPQPAFEDPPQDDEEQPDLPLPEAESPPPPSTPPPEDEEPREEQDLGAHEEEEEEEQVPKTPPPVAEETPDIAPLEETHEGENSEEPAHNGEEVEEVPQAGGEEEIVGEGEGEGEGKPEEAVQPEEDDEGDWVSRFKEFYEIHNPAKVDGVVTIMSRYESHQEKQELWEMLLKKYDRTEENWRELPEIQDEY
eukprot:TRINITY_DN5365_c0_g4_i4.p1 TRINITY_DN5365_c0_g4~~TRINITY_DN5365_c0_g4_i4.p1  ORF type:complete len:504 (+),score=83.22 TRINITY_DN5365_c0_g4_i4:59-1570(+)